MNIKRIDGPAPGASENTAFTIGFKLPVRPKGCPYCGHDLELKLSDDPVKQFSWKCTSCEYHRPNTGYQNYGLNELRDAIYEDAVAHGLWEDVEKTALAWSKEEPPTEQERYYTLFRRTQAAKLVFFEGDELLSAAEEESWDNLQEELADVVIQAFSTAGYLGIDIDAAIRRKMEINKGRPWKHEEEKK